MSELIEAYGGPTSDSGKELTQLRDILQTLIDIEYKLTSINTLEGISDLASTALGIADDYDLELILKTPINCMIIT